MSREIKRLDGALLLRYGALDYFLERHDVVPCANCQKLNCLSKLCLDAFPGQNCLRHFRCRDCKVYDALLMSKVLELLIVVALDPAIMDLNNPYLIAMHIREMLGKFLPEGRWIESHATLIPDIDRVIRSPLWLPS